MAPRVKVDLSRVADWTLAWALRHQLLAGAILGIIIAVAAIVLEPV